MIHDPPTGLVWGREGLLITQRCRGPPAQCSTVQYSAVQYSTVQHSTVQHSTAQQHCTAAQHNSTVQHNTVQPSTVQPSTVQHNSTENRTGGGLWPPPELYYKRGRPEAATILFCISQNVFVTQRSRKQRQRFWTAFLGTPTDAYTVELSTTRRGIRLCYCLGQ